MSNPPAFTVTEPERRLDRREWLRGRDYRLVTDELVLKEWANKLQRGDVFGSDWETDRLNRFTGPIPVGWSFSLAPGTGLYVPLHHTTDAHLNMPEGMVFDLLNRLDADGIFSAWWNFIYDSDVGWRRAKLDLQNWEDVMIAAWIYDPFQKEKNLKAATRRILGVPVIDYDSVTSGRAFQELSPVEATAYACGDADHTRQIWFKVTETPWFQVQASVYRKIEKPFTLVLRDELPGGVGVHGDRLVALGETLGKLERTDEDIEVPTSGLLLASYNTITEMAGTQINLNSPPQVGKLLMRLGVPITEKTDTGQIATGAEVLEGYAHPACQAVTRWRKLVSLKRNYVDKVEAARAFFQSDRLRFPFLQCGADTGRTACGGDGYEAGYCPINIQSMPKVEKRDKGWLPDARTMFVAAPPSEAGADEWVTVAIDYKQLQMRIAADLSQEPVWVRAFNEEGRDFHLENAKMAFGENVGEDKRDIGKTMSFAILFQAQDATVAAHGGIEVELAAKLTKRFRESTPTLQRWVGAQMQHARQHGWVQTVFGRRFNLTRYTRSPNERIQAEGDRKSINSPIQGSEADIFKIAAARVYRLVRERGWQETVRQMMWVHDELVLAIHRSVLEVVVPAIQDVMRIPVKNWPVPLLTSAGMGDSWSAAK